MTTAIFADDLYAGTRITGGRGLFAFCGATAGWYYERHHAECKPGLWRVGTYAGAWDDMLDEFHPALQSVDAVVDDFGNLRRVS